MKQMMWVGALAAGLLSGAIAAEKPNVIYILADDLGYGEVGFNGQKMIETPRLNQMAKDGAVFSQFYAGAPVCGPSRAAFLYGQHSGHNPIRGNPRWTYSGEKPLLKEDDILISHEMKRAGYSTAVFGKWGMNEVITSQETGDGIGHPLRQGFDEFAGFNTHVEAHHHWPDYYWDGYQKINLVDPSEHGKKANYRKREAYADDIFHRKALDYIARKANDQPFFIYLCYTIPHLGHTVPKEDSNYYKKKGWPQRRGRTEWYEMDEESHSAYAGMITRLDRYVGEILDTLKERGIAENTLVFFTSDNGHAVDYSLFDSNGPLRGRKRNVTEGGIRVPTAAVWPGVIQPGRNITTPLAFWDLLPTFTDIGGIDTHVDTDGLSFLPALQGKMDQQREHEVLYWEFNEKEGPKQAIRFGNWKAVRLWSKEQNSLGPVELYDLTADIGEANNIAQQHPEIVGRAEKLFVNSRTEHPEWPLTLRKPSAN